VKLLSFWSAGHRHVAPLNHTPAPIRRARPLGRKPSSTDPQETAGLPTGNVREAPDRPTRSGRPPHLGPSTGPAPATADDETHPPATLSLKQAFGISARSRRAREYHDNPAGRHHKEPNSPIRPKHCPMQTKITMNLAGLGKTAESPRASKHSVGCDALEAGFNSSLLSKLGGLRLLP